MGERPLPWKSSRPGCPAAVPGQAWQLASRPQRCWKIRSNWVFTVNRMVSECDQGRRWLEAHLDGHILAWGVARLSRDLERGHVQRHPLHILTMTVSKCTRWPQLVHKGAGCTCYCRRGSDQRYMARKGASRSGLSCCLAETRGPDPGAGRRALQV